MGVQVFPQPSTAGEPDSFSITLATTYTGTPNGGDILNGIANFNATTTLSQGYYEVADGAGYVGTTGYTRFSTSNYSYAIVNTSGTIFGVTASSAWQLGGQSPGGEYSSGVVWKVRQIGNTIWGGFQRWNVAGGVPEAGGSIRVSTDAGSSWTAIVLTTDSRAATDIWHDGTYIWARDTAAVVYNSTNSLNFNIIATGQNNWNTAMYDTSTGFHIGGPVSGINYLTVSSNGVTWSSRALSTTQLTYQTKRAGNFLFTMGASASAYISTNASDWTKLTTGTNSWGFTTSAVITDVEFKSPWYIACSSRGEIYVSTNTSVWSQRVNESGIGGASIWSLVNDGDKVLAFGGYVVNSTTLGTHLISTAGLNYSQIGVGFLAPGDGTQKHTDRLCYFTTAVNGFRYVAVTYPSPQVFPMTQENTRNMNGDTLMRTNSFSGVIQTAKNLLIKKFNLTSRLS
jgi:hypothetical protein